MWLVSDDSASANNWVPAAKGGEFTGPRNISTNASGNIAKGKVGQHRQGQDQADARSARCVFATIKGVNGLWRDRPEIRGS
jgi:hypothetical protein